MSPKSLTDYPSAHAYYRKSLFLFRKINDPRCIASSLEALAGLMMAQKQTERAGRLWGAAELLREEIGAPLTPNDLKEYNCEVAAARAAVGEAALLVAWAQGRSMTIEHVLEESVA